MQAIETAWKQWFSQFSDNVFTDGELIEDPQNILYPRITFSYSMSDAFTNTLTTFQVWDWGHNSARLWGVCNRISEAVSVISGTALNVSSETYYEYKNPITSEWGRFEVADFQAIADQFAPTTIEWRRVEGESAGSIAIWRGQPFLTSRPSDEPLSRVMYGTLECRYRNIV